MPTTADVTPSITGAVTVIVTVAGEDVPPALVAVYVNVSEPEYPDVGVYVIVVPTAVATPWDGEVATATLVGLLVTLSVIVLLVELYGTV